MLPPRDAPMPDTPHVTLEQWRTRLFTAIAGFKNNGLNDGSWVWWVPLVAPMLGGPLGARG